MLKESTTWTLQAQHHKRFLIFPLANPLSHLTNYVPRRAKYHLEVAVNSVVDAIIHVIQRLDDDFHNILAASLEDYTNKDIQQINKNDFSLFIMSKVHSHLQGREMQDLFKRWISEFKKTCE